MSSSTPTRQITAAATSTARESSRTVGSLPRNGSVPGISAAAAGGQLPSVEVDRYGAAQLVDGLVAGQRGSLPAPVGAAHRHRAGAAQDLPGQLVVGHPEGDGVLVVAEVHPQARLHPADD